MALRRGLIIRNITFSAEGEQGTRKKQTQTERNLTHPLKYFKVICKLLLNKNMKIVKKNFHTF